MIKMELLFEIWKLTEREKFEIRFGNAARFGPMICGLLVDADIDFKYAIAGLNEVQPWSFDAIRHGLFEIKASTEISVRTLEDLILAGTQSGFRGESLLKVFGYFFDREWAPFAKFGVSRIHPRTLSLIYSIVPVCYDRVPPPHALQWFFRRVGGFNRLGKLEQVESLAWKIASAWAELQIAGHNSKRDILQELGPNSPPWLLENARGNYSELDSELKAKAVVSLFGRNTPEWEMLKALFGEKPEILIQQWSKSPKVICKTALRCVRAWAQQEKESPTMSGQMAPVLNARRAYFASLAELVSLSLAGSREHSASSVWGAPACSPETGFEPKRQL